MKKRLFYMIFIILLLAPICAQASLKDKLDDLRAKSAARNEARKNETRIEPARQNFWFWLNEQEGSYAQWERVSGGVNFRIKMINKFPYDNVDAYTFEISAKNAYKEPILLKASDGTSCEVITVTGEKVFAPGKSGYTEYFKLRSDEKIRYVYAKLVKYHTDEATINISKDSQPEYSWKID